MQNIEQAGIIVNPKSEILRQRRISLRLRNPKSSVVIVGAGISGLCVAYWLKKNGISVTLLERDASVGGTMKTIREEGWMIESGPNSALETTPLLQELFTELGIVERRLYASEAASKRFIVRGSRLRALPMSAGSFLRSDLWSLTGKLRLLKEPFVGRARREETVAEFVERRLGKEFLDYAINPFVAGVYAGDPARLSVQSAFPKLYALEKEHGGLIMGAIASRKERKKRKEIAKDRARLFSFRDGMQTFPYAIAAALGDAVQLNTSVEQIIPMRAGKYPVYTIAASQNGVRQTIQADAVVLSTPAYVAANIVRAIDPDMASTLESIYYPPVAEVFLGFRQEQVKRVLDGFGFLVPEIERRNILGTIWSSTLFPHRAPEGCVALTSFVGGARQPELVSRDDEEISRLVRGELKALMGVEGEPIFTKTIRWDRAIPQYNIGYHKTLAAMDRFEENFQRAFLCSNYRGGIAVGDCLMNAESTVKRVLAVL